MPSTFTHMSWFEFFVSMIESAAFQQTGALDYLFNIHSFNSMLLANMASFKIVSYLFALSFLIKYLLEAAELAVKYLNEPPYNNPIFSELKKLTESRKVILTLKYIQCYTLLELLLYKMILKVSAKRTLFLLYYFIYQITLAKSDIDYCNIWGKFDKFCLSTIKKFPNQEKICIVYTILSEKLKAIIRFISNVREL